MSYFQVNRLILLNCIYIFNIYVFIKHIEDYCEFASFIHGGYFFIISTIITAGKQKNHEKQMRINLNICIWNRNLTLCTYTHVCTLNVLTVTWYVLCASKSSNCAKRFHTSDGQLWWVVMNEEHLNGMTADRNSMLVLLPVVHFIYFR